MGFVSDARKGYRLLKRAVAARASAQRIRQRFADQEPHAPGRFRIAVYFADSSVNMYQIRQWYRPLQELSRTHEVVVLARSAVGAEALLDDGELPVVHLPTIRDLEAYIATQDIRIVLYVNQNTRNFQMFRYGHRWHVFINHGESDKVYMVSNQFRSYDYAFIAGEAARARLSKALWNYDVDTRTIQIGRPQADHFSATVPYPDDDRTVVLYAPTWEGDRASMSYGSIRTHGTELVRQVLANPGHRLIYRPHPRSGVIDPEYGAANKDIIRAIAEANAADPSAHHVYDDGPEVGWQLAAADVAVLDISAMIYDRLATGRPLMVTRPADPEATVDETGYLSVCEWLTAEAARDSLAEIERVRTDAAATERLATWSQHYFGDTTQGVATEKFHAAIEQLLAEWDKWYALMPAVVIDQDDDAEAAAEESDVPIVEL